MHVLMWYGAGTFGPLRSARPHPCWSPRRSPPVPGPVPSAPYGRQIAASRTGQGPILGSNTRIIGCAGSGVAPWVVPCGPQGDRPACTGRDLQSCMNARPDVVRGRDFRPPTAGCCRGLVEPLGLCTPAGAPVRASTRIAIAEPPTQQPEADPPTGMAPNAASCSTCTSTHRSNL